MSQKMIQKIATIKYLSFLLQWKEPDVKLQNDAC